MFREVVSAWPNPKSVSLPRRTGTTGSYCYRSGRCVTGSLKGARNCLFTAFLTMAMFSHQAILDNLRAPRKTIIEIVREQGYPIEEHLVQTEDGYLLTLHRIPFSPKFSFGPSLDVNVIRGRRRPVIFLQHGLAASAGQWVMGNSSNSLGFALADQGFDVWMGNYRGNEYSRNHTSWHPTEKRFWHFSWDEMGRLDLPAMIKHALNATGHQKLVYIGHSMGTTGLLVALSMRPELQQCIQKAYFLAPIAYLKHTSSPVRRLAPMQFEILAAYEALTSGEFLGSFQELTKVLALLCGTGYGVKTCMKSLMTSCGGDSSVLDLDLAGRLTQVMPAGSSARTFAHYGQSINSGKFRRFDHGFFGNLAIYKSHQPPAYNLSIIQTNITIFWSRNDFFADERDVMQLVGDLPSAKDVYLIKRKTFGHIDYLISNDIKTMLMKPLLTRIMHDLDENDNYL